MALGLKASKGGGAVSGENIATVIIGVASLAALVLIVWLENR